jgi:hypothetical protein
LSGDYRGHDMDHSGWPEMQAKSERAKRRRWNGDGFQMIAGDSR